MSASEFELHVPDDSDDCDGIFDNPSDDELEVVDVSNHDDEDSDDCMDLTGLDKDPVPSPRGN